MQNIWQTNEQLNCSGTNIQDEESGRKKEWMNAQIGLIRFGNGDVALTDPALDIRDRKIIDCYGKEIGRVSDLFFDKKEREMRFLEVDACGFLGALNNQFLVPVEVANGLSEDAVVINQTCQRVVDAPAYNPRLISQSYCEDICRYYGYAPYWRVGYFYLPSN